MENPDLLPHLEIEPSSGTEASTSVIWLHGLGADGHDFEPVAHMVGSQLSKPVRFILPHAPSMPVTINGGMRMPAWYDMLDLTVPRRVDWGTVRQSHEHLQAFVEREKSRDIEPSRIFLAGFSQGGAMVLYTAIRAEVPFGGVLALSTYWLQEDPEDPGKGVLQTNKGTPIFMAHGVEDPVIPYDLAVKSKEVLEGFGCPLEWRTYTMPHCVCPEEIEHLIDWLESQL